MEGLSTLTGSIGQAQERADFLLAECRRHLDKQDVSAFLKVLDQNPHLVVDAWVRETLGELTREKRLSRRLGRPAGRYEMHPLVVVGWVDQLIASGAAKNRDKAFALLEERGWMAYDTAKDLFYQALREERFRPVLLALPEQTRKATEEDMAALRRGQTIEPGASATRTITDAEGGKMEVTIKTERTK